MGTVGCIGMIISIPGIVSQGGGIVLPQKGGTLNDYTWAEISVVSRAGLAAEYWSVGDQKNIDIIDPQYASSGAQHLQVDIIGFDHDPPTDAATYGRSKTGITFQSHQTFITSANMHSANAYYNGWGGTTARTQTMPALMEQIESELRSVIVPVNKPYNSQNGVLTSSDSFFLISATEMNGATNTTSYVQEGTLYEYYTNATNWGKTIGGALGAGSAARWWTRTCSKSAINQYLAIKADGSKEFVYPTSAKRYFAPCFCV